MHGLRSQLKKKAYDVLIDLRLIRTVEANINGKRVVLKEPWKSSILKDIASFGFESYENDLVRFIKHYPWDLSAFIDGGANIGFYSMLCEAYHPGAEIVALEPFHKNVEYINWVKETNGFSFNVIPKALDSEGSAPKKMYIPAGKNSSELSSSASLLNSFKGTGGIYNHISCETIEVETISLDEVLSLYKAPSLIKLDCEGSEFDILESSEKWTDEKDVDFIVEILITDKKKNDLFGLMKRHGYDAYLITNAGLVRENRPLTLPYPFVTNRTLWKNHLFTTKPVEEIEQLSLRVYGYFI